MFYILETGWKKIMFFFSCRVWATSTCIINLHSSLVSRVEQTSAFRRSLLVIQTYIQTTHHCTNHLSLPLSLFLKNHQPTDASESNISRVPVWTSDNCCDRQKSAGSDHKNRSATHSTGQIHFIILQLSLTQDFFLCLMENRTVYFGAKMINAWMQLKRKKRKAPVYFNNQTNACI